MGMIKHTNRDILLFKKGLILGTVIGILIYFLIDKLFLLLRWKIKQQWKIKLTGSV